jgi:hypothetical protein
LSLSRIDFNGDGLAEIQVSSPWGRGFRELPGSRLNSTMASNGAGFGWWLLNSADDYFRNHGRLRGDGKAEPVADQPFERARVSFVSAGKERVAEQLVPVPATRARAPFHALRSHISLMNTQGG